MPKTRRLLFALAGMLAVALPGTAGAAGQGIGLAPALKEVVINEGEASVSFKVTLVNSTASPASLEVSAMDFGALDESGGIAFLGKTGQESAYGLSEWISFDKTRVTLAPNSSDQVTVTIANRDSLRPGGHYGAVVVSQASSRSSDDVTIVPSASTLVLLRKNGGEELRLELGEAKANSSLINVPKSVSLKFQNTGNTHVVSRGTIELSSPSGKIISRAVINEASSFVLPGTTRNFNLELGNFSQPWLPGRYKLSTVWRWDGKEDFTTTVSYHWYIGKLLLYSLMAGSSLIVLIMYINYRRRPLTRN